MRQRLTFKRLNWSSYPLTINTVHLSFTKGLSMLVAEREDREIVAVVKPTRFKFRDKFGNPIDNVVLGTDQRGRPSYVRLNLATWQGATYTITEVFHDRNCVHIQLDCEKKIPTLNVRTVAPEFGGYRHMPLPAPAKPAVVVAPPAPAPAVHPAPAVEATPEKKPRKPRAKAAPKADKPAKAAPKAKKPAKKAAKPAA